MGVEQMQFAAATQVPQIDNRGANSANFNAALRIVFTGSMVLVLCLALLVCLEMRRGNFKRLDSLIRVILLFSVLDFLLP